MKTLAKYDVSNQCVIGENIKNVLFGPGKLPGLSRNGPKEQLTTTSGSRGYPTRIFKKNIQMMFSVFLYRVRTFQEEYFCTLTQFYLFGILS